LSGAVTDRPALREALAFARSGDTLIVWKLDRLARSMKQLIETIEELRLKGIGFRSLTEALDTTTAQGRLVFHMFGALAEFERSLIRERTQAGLAAARRVGRTGGRPPKLTDDDIEAAKAMLANPDIAVTQIAHRLGVSPVTLYSYIPAARTAKYPRRLTATALPQRPDAPGGFSSRRLAAAMSRFRSFPQRLPVTYLIRIAALIARGPAPSSQLGPQPFAPKRGAGRPDLAFAHRLGSASLVGACRLRPICSPGRMIAPAATNATSRCRRPV
jgi:DNA invertase Pin-like site-specific DNA recombinase